MLLCVCTILFHFVLLFNQCSMAIRNSIDSRLLVCTNWKYKTTFFCRLEFIVWNWFPVHTRSHTHTYRRRLCPIWNHRLTVHCHSFGRRENKTKRKKSYQQSVADIEPIWCCRKTKSFFTEKCVYCAVNANARVQAALLPRTGQQQQMIIIIINT